ncbi:DUF2521 family protein [Alteribacillus sp. HJP-4]|uniref:DUF2521 family protein n=1 Tax=Alteribacillus sp. HJP-4 TaxID=2775394 RepID=UPI0035CD3007
MGIVISMEPRRLKKEWEQEKKLLQNLKVSEMQQSAQKSFSHLFQRFHFPNSFLEEACLDMALDAFLDGGKHHRYMENGVLPFRFKLQAAFKIGNLAKELTSFMFDWVEDSSPQRKLIQEAAEGFITDWWKKGLETGFKRQRLRL